MGLCSIGSTRNGPRVNGSMADREPTLRSRLGRNLPPSDQSSGVSPISSPSAVSKPHTETGMLLDLAPLSASDFVCGSFRPWRESHVTAWVNTWGRGRGLTEGRGCLREQKREKLLKKRRDQVQLPELQSRVDPLLYLLLRIPR